MGGFAALGHPISSFVFETLRGLRRVGLAATYLSVPRVRRVRGNVMRLDGVPREKQSLSGFGKRLRQWLCPKATENPCEGGASLAIKSGAASCSVARL